MKRILNLTTYLCFLTISLFGQNSPTQQTASQPSQQWAPEATEWYKPVPARVAPGTGTKPPSDAIILFDGKDLSKWVNNSGETPNIPISNGEVHIGKKSGGMRTKQYFGDCQLHVEFKTPMPGETTGQHQGNSGVMMPGGYEIQILDCDNNPTYVNGMIGSVYKQSAPLVNAFTKNGEWQAFDIYWKAPVFNGDGEVLSPAMVTVVLNGVVVQNNYILKGNTPYRGLPSYRAHGRGQISLQDHGDDYCVSFRNIWIRDL
jgi:hypothetical protein